MHSHYMHKLLHLKAQVCISYFTNISGRALLVYEATMRLFISEGIKFQGFSDFSTNLNKEKLYCRKKFYIVGKFLTS